MTAKTTIPSNDAGLRYAEEASFKVLPASPVWNKLEPNSYGDFGGQRTLLARRPISADRQRKKGVITGLDANGAFNTDLTQSNLQDLLQGFLFADLRRKGEDVGPLVGGLAGVTFTPVQYTASNDSGDILFTIGSAHGLSDFDGPFHFVEGIGVLPGNVTEDTQYWVKVIAPTTFKIATTLANAIVGTFVAFTTAGTDDATRLFHRRDSVDGTNEYLYVNDDSDVFVGSLVFLAGFSSSGTNNGLRRVTAKGAPGRLTVAENLSDEAVAPAAATIVAVGFQGTAGDIDVDAASTFPALTSTVLDFTTLGLVEGEFIFVGGDGASEDFTNVENNGFKRVRTIAAQRLEFDKSGSTMITEPSTTETIRLFFGRVLKNESNTSLIVRRTYNLERTLGAPDDALPAEVQAEYLEGAVPSQATFNIPSEDKINVDLEFVAGSNSTIDGPTSLKAGTRPALADADAFNTSSDFSRIRLAQHTDGNEAPIPLFAFSSELKLVVNNNVSPNKAVGVLGAFEVNTGVFEVSATITAYFANVAAVEAINSNVDVTLDFALVKENAGVVVDLPLIALGDGRPAVEQDRPITIPLSIDAATAAKIDPNLDYTLMFVFYDYLPDAADIAL